MQNEKPNVSVELDQIRERITSIYLECKGTKRELEDDGSYLGIFHPKCILGKELHGFGQSIAIVKKDFEKIEQENAEGLSEEIRNNVVSVLKDLFLQFTDNIQKPEYASRLGSVATRIYSEEENADHLLSNIQTSYMNKSNESDDELDALFNQMASKALELARVAAELDARTQEIKQRGESVSERAQDAVSGEEAAFKGFVHEELSYAESVHKDLVDIGKKGFMLLEDIFHEDNKAETLFAKIEKKLS